MEYYPYATIENVEQAIFEDGAKNAPVTELIVSIDPVQGGEGIPSPTNIRPISGSSEVEIIVDGGSVEKEYDISLGAGAEIYGGTLNVKTGVLTITKGIKVFTGTESWERATQNNPNGTIFTLSGGMPFKKFSDAKDTAIGSASVVSSADSFTTATGFYWTFSPQGWRYLWGEANNASTVEQFKAYLAAKYAAETPVTICADLETPQTVQLTPTEVKTLWLNNTITVDTGKIIKLTYQIDRVMYYRRFFMINSGYILVDGSGIDLSSSSSQTVAGFHDKCKKAIETGKPIFLYNTIYGSGVPISPVPCFARYGSSNSIILNSAVLQITVTTANAVTVADLTDTN